MLAGEKSLEFSAEAGDREHTCGNGAVQVCLWQVNVGSLLLLAPLPQLFWKMQLEAATAKWFRSHTLKPDCVGLNRSSITS